MLSVVILVGGLGSRLRPLSYDLPKPLMPIAGRPALELILERLPEAQVFLAAGYGFQAFEDFCQRFPKVQLVREEIPLGTAGALTALSAKLTGDILVLNGDTFVDVDFSELVEQHRSRGCYASILGVHTEDASRYGRLETIGNRLVSFKEKQPGTGLINAGVYILSEIAQVPVGAIERDVFPMWLDQGKDIGVSVSSGIFIDFGTIQSYLDVQKLALEGKLWPGLGPSPERVWIGPDAQVSSSARLVGPVVLGAGAEVGSESTLENCILWDNAQVGSHCRLTNCILGRNVVVEDGVIAANLVQVAPGLEPVGESQHD